MSFQTYFIPSELFTWANQDDVANNEGADFNGANSFNTTVSQRKCMSVVPMTFKNLRINITINNNGIAGAEFFFTTSQGTTPPTFTLADTVLVVPIDQLTATIENVSDSVTLDAGKAFCVRYSQGDSTCRVNTFSVRGQSE